MSVAAPPKARPTAVEHLSRELLDSYLGDERARRIARRYLPSREAITEILEGVLDLMYPGYFGRRDLNAENLGAYVAESIRRRRIWMRSSSPIRGCSRSASTALRTRCTIWGCP
jgi:hypothetical protein